MGGRPSRHYPSRIYCLRSGSLFITCLHILEFISFTQVSLWTGYVEPSDSVGADHFAGTGSQLESLSSSPHLLSLQDMP